MGCDIHGWVEKKVDGKWVALQELPDKERDYDRFARLAGVRVKRSMKSEDIGDPHGLPNDASDTVKYWVDYWGIDGHSHSHLTLEEATKRFGGSEETEVWEYFDKFEDDFDECRLVFWFDN